MNKGNKYIMLTLAQFDPIVKLDLPTLRLKSNPHEATRGTLSWRSNYSII